MCPVLADQVTVQPLEELVTSVLGSPLELFELGFWSPPE